MRAWIPVSAIVLLAACSTTAPDAPAVGVTSSAVRSITQDEAQADFGEIVDSLRGLWGAQERKEERYGFSFERLADDYANKIAAASDEREYAALYREFLARLEDAHISLSYPIEPDELEYFSLPLRIMPIEDTYVVYAVAGSDEETPVLARGDELLSIDGVPTAELVKQFSIYDGVPNPLTLKHIAAARVTGRYNYMSPDLKDGDAARLELRKPNGEESEVTVNWYAVPRALPPTTIPSIDSPNQRPVAISRAGRDVVDAELRSLGVSVPFFMTPQVQAKYAVELVVVSDAALDKFNVDRELAESGKYLAFRYTYCGKTFLLLRLPDYVPYDLADAADEIDLDQSIGYLRALLADQAPLVDGLVVDDTHNPGGSVALVDRFVALLAEQPINAIVQKMNADRIWIGAYVQAAQQIRANSDEADPARAVELEGYAHQIDLAYTDGKALSAPLPFPYEDLSPIVQPDDAHWRKPFIMLADELSFSGGDATPLLVQTNQLAPVFGQTTAGAGGNVSGALLTHTGLVFALSRGVFAAYDPTGEYPESRFVEDHGVTPDIAYSHTLADFRAGYVDYVDAFSDVLLGEIDHHH